MFFRSSFFFLPPLALPSFPSLHSPLFFSPPPRPPPTLLQDLEKKAGEEIKELDEKLAAAKESGGETEIQEIQFSKANVLAKHGDFEASNAIYAEIKAEKKVSSGKKIEAGFGEARNMLFANLGIGKLMEEVAEYCKLGGDWDKRNRHATYLSLHNLRDREIEKAADSMKAGVKTFNAEEVISFKEVRTGRSWEGGELCDGIYTMILLRTRCAILTEFFFPSVFAFAPPPPFVPTPPSPSSVNCAPLPQS